MFDLDITVFIKVWPYLKAAVENSPVNCGSTLKLNKICKI